MQAALERLTKEFDLDLSDTEEEPEELDLEAKELEAVPDAVWHV